MDLIATASDPLAAGASRPVPSRSQLAAIEAVPGPLLVLAGPGAGKTFCLIERIRYLVQALGVEPSRICAFTFTNKAAGEITERLKTELGTTAEAVTRGTIHAFCAALLRDAGSHLSLDRGFGIADEEYQLGVLRRLEGPQRRHPALLNRFSTHRFRGDPLPHDELALFERYRGYLAERRMVDFDTLVLRAAELLDGRGDPDGVRRRWDAILVDEFQDLNPIQYRIVRALARDHRHVFAVGDDEQAIYSWAGADTRVFTSFANDFEIAGALYLEENRRCPREAFALARRLIGRNATIFANRVQPRTDRESRFPVTALTFATDAVETDWIIADLERDRSARGNRWGDAALLYRQHRIGDRLEAALINAGIPCRLASGRALAEDRAVAYVLAAARAITRPGDDVCEDGFLRVSLPRMLLDEARSQAESRGITLRRMLRRMQRGLPRAHPSGRQIRRALANLSNLAAFGAQTTSLMALVQELLSVRVGAHGTTLDDHHDEITDPAAHPEVVQLAAALRYARAAGDPVTLPRMDGCEIPLSAMLAAAGFTASVTGRNRNAGGVALPLDVAALGAPLALFKALQLIEIGDPGEAAMNFTTIDIETTDRDPATAAVVQVAAVRVRGGVVVDAFESLVRPEAPIAAAATAVHGLTEADVADAPGFADVWTGLRAFCGSDVVMAHNGYDFDFRILARLARAHDQPFSLAMYDTLPLARDLLRTNCSLEELARRFEIDPARAHRAPDDARTLAQVRLALERMKLARARKTALGNLLEHLGVALALSDDGTLSAEARLFRDLCRPYSLGRHGGALDWYERERGTDTTIPSVEEAIERLGGIDVMQRIRREKSADDRYPVAMARLRRLISQIPDGPLIGQLTTLLERVALSKWEGHEPARDRVNLLTLHSTKGLEFSRVYVIGAEDALLPGSPPHGPPSEAEVEEARRLLYVGMTRTMDRLVLTRVASRDGRPTGGHRFLDEMGLVPGAAS